MCIGSCHSDALKMYNPQEEIKYDYNDPKYKFKDNYDEYPQMINWELDNDEHHAAIGHASAEERAECSDEVSEHV